MGGRRRGAEVHSRVNCRHQLITKGCLRKVSGHFRASYAGATVSRRRWPEQPALPCRRSPARPRFRALPWPCTSPSSIPSATPHRQAAAPGTATGQRLRQGRVIQSGRLGQGPPGAGNHPRRRSAWPAQARRHDRGGHLGQHRRGAGDGRCARGYKFVATMVETFRWSVAN